MRRAIAAALLALSAPAAAQDVLPLSGVETALFGCLNADLDIEVLVERLESHGWVDTPPERLGERAFRALAAKLAVNYIAMQEPNASWPGIWEAQMDMARAHGRRAAVPGRRFLTHPGNRSFVDVSSTAYDGGGTIRCEIVADPDSLGPGIRGSVLPETGSGDPPVFIGPAADLSEGDETATVSAIVLDGPAISEATGAPFPFAAIVSVFRRAPS